MRLAVIIHYLMNKKKILGTILKCLLIITIFVFIALGCYFLLKALGFTTKDDIISLRDKLGDSWLLWLVIGFLQIIQVIFIPITNQIITVPCALVFNNELWKVWLTSWISIWIATMILYFIGRFGGEKLLKWVLGDKEQVEKCTNWLRKGWIFYPLGMLLPLPDDIITALAGTSKMNFVFVMVSSFITRAIDTACSVFGLGYLTRFWWGWIILGVGVIILVVATIVFWKLDKRYDKRKSR